MSDPRKQHIESMILMEAESFGPGSVQEMSTLSGHALSGHLDSSSETWKIITQWAKSELQKAREKNDSPRLGIEQTSTIRGEIGFIKKLLNLPSTIERERTVRETCTPVTPHSSD